jgi:uncharacterized protein YjbI with pentapeptide repeats
VLSRAAVLVALVALVGLAGGSRAAGGGEKTVTANTLAQPPRQGPLVLRSGSVVPGDFRFDSKLRHGLTCRNCRFKGNIDLQGSEIDGPLQLPGATFAGVVDLRGAQVEGRVDMSQAHFARPVLASALATFGGPVDFSLADFTSLVSFKTATFEHGARFTLARFGSDAIFAEGRSTGGAHFARASFQGSADFDGFQFESPVTFEGAFFKGHTDFSDASFAQVSFGRAVFGSGATFVAASFTKVCPYVPGDTFNDVESGEDLNFSFAEIHSPIDFESIGVEGTFSFDGATAAIEKTGTATKKKVKVSCNGQTEEIDQQTLQEIEQRRLHFLHTTAGALEMSVALALGAVNSEDRWSVLALIESSAKARGDLGTANDAHFASHVLKSQGYALPWHVLDFVFYRTFAGYLVRPSNPLVVLLVLAAAMALYRAARAATGEEARPVTVAARTAAGLPRSFVQTILLIVPARWVARDGGGAASIDRSGTFLQIESFTYRVLFACVLIGLANSNPTLRQMLDAIS